MEAESGGTMNEDIFDFWSGLPDDIRQHPQDEAVLARVRHGFQLDCLPGPFQGRLRDAPVVLLFLSSGFREEDVAHGVSAAGQGYFGRSRSGLCSLPSTEEHEGGVLWARKIIRQFGIDYSYGRSKFAYLNICPYRSRSFNDWHMLSALPSCRVALDWAQTVLFPQARDRKRVAICLRSARYWGLEPGSSPAGHLFAPKVQRSGTMLHGEMREEICRLVRSACDAKELS